MDRKVVESAKDDLNLAGVRAATILKHLLATQQIPEHHVAHVREICDAHIDATTRWYAAIGVKEAA